MCVCISDQETECSQGRMKEGKKKVEREKKKGLLRAADDNRSIDGHKRLSLSFSQESFLSPAFIYCFVLRSIMLSLLFIK